MDVVRVVWMKKEEKSMRRHNLLWIGALLLLITVGAAAQDIRYNFDKNADFSKFKTYKWVPIKGAQPPDDLVDKQIKETFDAELAKKGLTKVDSDDADLFVGYQT